MLLEITSDNLFLDSQACAANQSLVVIPRRWHLYEQASKPIGKQWLRWDPAKGKLYIQTHPFGIWPLSYHISPDLIIVSHSAGEVAWALKQKGKQVKPDEIGVWESLYFYLPLGRRTLFREINKTRLGESLVLYLASGQVENRKHWQPQLYGEITTDDPLSDAVDVLQSIFGDIDQESLLLPLSGGLDSRLMAAMLSHSRADVQAFTFGSFGSAEVRFARNVARTLEVPWEEVTLRPKDYYEYGKELTALTGGTLSPMHMHLYSCLSRMGSIDKTCMYGFLGEHIAGDHAYGLKLEHSSQKALDTLIEHLVGKAWYVIPSDASEQIHKDLERILEDCQVHNPPGCLMEYLSVAERQNMIAYIPAVMETKANILRPYADSRYVNFFLSLPPELRIGRKLFQEACRHMFPDLFALPSTTHPFGRWVPTALTRQWVRCRNALQYSTVALTGGKFATFSPFIYEQRAFILKYYLIDEAWRCTTTLSDALRYDLTRIFRDAMNKRNYTIPFAIMGVAWAMEAFAT